MRGLLLIVCVCMLAAVPALAQPLPGGVGVYADEYSFNCDIVEGAYGPYIFLYFIHVAPEPVSAVDFGVDMSGVVGWTHQGDESPWFLRIGSFDSFIQIAYMGCVEGNIYLGRSVYYAPYPSTPPCTQIQVIGHWPNITPHTITCYPELEVETGGGYAVVNPEEGCHCADSVPVEESSWGQIKSLYQ